MRVFYQNKKFSGDAVTVIEQIALRIDEAELPNDFKMSTVATFSAYNDSGFCEAVLQAHENNGELVIVPDDILTHGMKACRL
jgi:hypothetical protein